MKRKIQITLILLISFFFPMVKANAENRDGQDILFVIDTSYSMGYNDPQNHIYDAIQTLGSISMESDNRIGYVLYNDSIVKSKKLGEIKNQAELDQMLNDLRSTVSIKGTDVGLGLKIGQQLLESSDARKNHTMVILLSDGDTETDTANPNRTQAAVDQDVESVLSTLSYPLYSIQYSEPELRNKEPMNQWPARTGGKTYSARNQSELIDAVLDIYSTQTKMAQTKDTIDRENEKEKTFTLTIPVPPKTEKQQTKELIVTMTAPVNIKNLTYDEVAEMSVSKSNDQIIIKIENPKKAEYQLSYQTENNEPVKTTTLTKMEDIPVEEPKPDPMLPYYIAIGLGVFLAVVIIGIILWRNKNKEKTVKDNQNYFFADSLECCFTKTPNNEEIPIQNWSASIFQRKKSITLYDLLQTESIRNQMPESKKVQFRVGANNSLDMKIKGKVQGIQQGRDIPKNVWVELNLQRGAYLIFSEDHLEMDLHIRKKGVRK